jgi:transketolase
MSNKNVFLLTGDLGYKLFDEFRKKNPDRFLNMGVAEPNMISVAAGLALSGKKVYCYSMIPFLVMRCFEQIRIDICSHNLDVSLIGAGCGFTYGTEGVTHHAIEDLAIMRSLPNMTVLSPADPLEVSACIDATLSCRGPVFIRLGKTASPSVHLKPLSGFRIGKGIKILNRGSDVCVLATGSMVYSAMAALKLLAEKKIGATLISMPTVKPLDEALIKKCAKQCKSIITVEEHSIIGGLGSAVAEVLAEVGYHGLFKRIGLPDSFNCFIGKSDFLLKQYGLSPEKIATNIKTFIKGR